METRKCLCLNCLHNQEVKKDNIYQDIDGKYVTCDVCGSTFNVEFENPHDLEPTIKSIRVSNECKNIIIETLEEHADTDIQSVHYSIIEHEDEDFTIEATDFTVMENGELVEVTAWEYNQMLTDDLNELLFTYIDEFKQGNEFGVIDLSERELRFKNLKEELKYYQEQSRIVKVTEQVNHFKEWVNTQLRNELIEAAKNNENRKCYKMEQFYFNGINTHDEMIHHLKAFCKKEGLKNQILDGKELQISWA